LPVLDLELLYNAITHTTHTITGRQSEDDAAFQMSLRHQYVLHSHLALSALHLVSISPHRRELLEAATSHQHAALQLVQPLIANPSVENTDALVLFSALTSIFSMAEPLYMTSDHGLQRDIIDDLINAFQLNRGINSILIMKWPDVGTNGIPDAPSLIEDEENLKLDLEEHFPTFSTVIESLHALCGNEDEVLACQKAMYRTSLYMRAIEVKPEVRYSRLLIQQWPHSLNKLFIAMLSSRHPAALVVLGYYAALMSMRSDTWWLCKWPSLIMKRVADLLGPEKSDLLAWPRQRIVDYDEIHKEQHRLQSTE